MKKITAILLSVILIFSLCACGSSEPDNKIIGKWTWEHYITNFHGGEDTKEVLNYEFFKNGTVVYTRDSDTIGDDGSEKTWEYSILDESRIKINGSVYNYSINGKILTLDGREYIKK